MIYIQPSTKDLCSSGIFEDEICKMPSSAAEKFNKFWFEKYQIELLFENCTFTKFTCRFKLTLFLS